MTMRIRIILVSVLLLAVNAVRLGAQTGINSTVEVERDYEGRITSIEKAPMDIPVDDSLLNFNLDFNYTTFYSPYKDLYEFSPTLTVGPADYGKVVYPWLYARLAASYPWTPSADLYVSPRLGGRFSFEVYVNHDSYWGKMPLTAYSGDRVVLSGEKSYGDRMRNKAGAAFGFRWKKGELGISAGYAASMYALNGGQGLSHKQIWNWNSNHFRHFDSRLNVRSVNSGTDAFYYNVDLGYRYFDNRSGVTEHLADADISMGAAFKEEHLLYLRFDGTFSNSGLWSLAPVYRWERDRWRIKASVVFSSAYGSGPSSSYRTLFYPDASVVYEAARNTLWLFAELHGEHRLLTRYDLYELNPWMDSGRGMFLKAVPVSLDLGLKGSVRDRFSYSLRAGYLRAADILSFISAGGYQRISGGSSHLLTAGSTLRWKSRDFFAQADLNYRYYTDSRAALMTPAFDIRAVMEYNLKRRLFIRADCYFRTSVTGAAAGAAVSDPVSYYRVPSFVDIGLRVSYAVNTSVMVFLEADNLANSKIQYYLNYVEPGISVGAGLCLKL